MSSSEHTMPDANRLYIGDGVTIKGEVTVPDTLVVCGVVEGDVAVGNLIVGETGAIKGRITVAENAEISGKVFEKLDVTLDDLRPGQIAPAPELGRGRASHPGDRGQPAFMLDRDPLPLLIG